MREPGLVAVGNAASLDADAVVGSGVADAVLADGELESNVVGDADNGLEGSASDAAAAALVPPDDMPTPTPTPTPVKTMSTKATMPQKTHALTPHIRRFNLAFPAQRPKPASSSLGVSMPTPLCRDAAKSGASHALMLPPSYYGGLLDDNKIVDYFHDVADQSPLPLLIYNFPGAAAGRDLSSDVILRIAAHPNVVGVKLTCGNTGKLARVAADAPEGFFVSGGSADFILQGMVVGAHGTISGLANVAPRACVRIMELFGTGRLLEARRLQAMAAKCDWVAIRTGFVGVKAAIGHFEGYGGEPRRPCVAPTPQELKGIVEGMAELRREEAALESEA
ncbi:hypothetical protein BN1723_004550 [Verticillium longisporum]|uniref:4-hydroxy-2-oxoglutarate aldolase, mitochondrial n=1 Tax=Verticillium longisporum TaxID=100787 RepID=A0A0G4MYQ0_VERLO|nr:hypothetical protein BN1723_004550 [Verticillium longisporum]